MNDNDTTPEAAARTGLPRWLKWGALGLVGAVIVGYGLIFLYAKVINDSPDELDESDLDSALAIGDTTPDEPADAATDDPDDPEPASTEAPAADSSATTATTEPAPADEAPATAEGISIWRIAPGAEGLELGYRVKEILFGVDTDAVGRTNQITGSLTIDGTRVTDAEFIVDVASISSDDDRRDSRFRGRIMSTDEFPDAIFALTQPIELGSEPGDGVEVATTAAGQLTLRGVTNDVTFELTAKQEGERIGVLGNIPVVFADYEIANPSVPGITTEDEGLLEFVLVFEPAT